MKQRTFESEYCKVDYIEDYNTVIIKWIKYCELENYRAPTGFALKLLQNYKHSNLIIDARNGFEDNEKDVEWAFEYLLPEMSRTTCKVVIFIMNQSNDIEDEMNMWEIEFKKYFKVIKTDNLDKGVLEINRTET